MTAAPPTARVLATLTVNAVEIPNRLFSRTSHLSPPLPIESGE